MKVVINRCWGGFGLSPKAIARLAELNGRPCFFFKQKRDNNWSYPNITKYVQITIEEAETDIMFYSFDIQDPECLETAVKWSEMTEKQKDNHNDNWKKHYLATDGEIERNDPRLVQVVEELGEQASGKLAKLVIVEIPDGTEWAIDDYDGMETVEEKHRSWS